jgi:hypothetical protein
LRKPAGEAPPASTAGLASVEPASVEAAGTGLALAARAAPGRNNPSTITTITEKRKIDLSMAPPPDYSKESTDGMARHRRLARQHYSKMQQHTQDCDSTLPWITAHWKNVWHDMPSSSPLPRLSQRP